MKRRVLKSKALAGLATLLLAGGLLVGAPAPRQAVASSCGENRGRLCKTNKSCVYLLFFSQCTTTYDYYPR